MKIEIISGSTREHSVTRRVGLYLQQYLQEKTEYEMGLIDMHDHALPPVETVYSSVEKAPAEYKDLAARMFEADAFILLTPEYNGSYTAALKNLLDHFPKQQHKLFGIVTASPGALGGIRAAVQLQLLIFALFGIGSPHMLIIPAVDKKFDAEGNLTEPSFQKNIDLFVNEFLWLAERVITEKIPA